MGAVSGCYAGRTGSIERASFSSQPRSGVLLTHTLNCMTLAILATYSIHCLQTVGPKLVSWIHSVAMQPSITELPRACGSAWVNRRLEHRRVSRRQWLDEASCFPKCCGSRE